MISSSRQIATSECWKSIAGYEGYYEVSDLGQVRSLPRKGSPRFFLLRQGNKCGYRSVGFQIARVDSTFSVHQLVARAFIPNPRDLFEVNHLNGNKADNRACNLDWCTRSENVQHAFDNGFKFGLKGESHPRALLTDEAVRQIRAKFRPRVYTRSMLAREYGVKPRTIKAVISRQLWGHV